MSKAVLQKGIRRGGSRHGGAISMRKALKSARAAGITVQQKPRTSLLKLTASNGDTISVSALDKEVTKNTAAWIASHGGE